MMVSWDSIWYSNTRLVKVLTPLIPSPFWCYINLILALGCHLRNPPDSSRLLKPLWYERAKIQGHNLGYHKSWWTLSQDHSLGDKENSLRLGCAKRVLDDKLNYMEQHWYRTVVPESQPSSPLESETGSQSLPPTTTSRRSQISAGLTRSHHHGTSVTGCTSSPPEAWGSCPFIEGSTLQILFKLAHKWFNLFSNLKVQAARTLCNLLSTNVWDPQRKEIR